MHQLWHLIEPLLDAAQARNVLEIGTGDGALTRLLLARAAQCGGIIHSVDIEASAEVRLLQEQSGSSFTFHHGSSLDVIPRITGIDAVIIDGDHNWYTVYHELLLIEKHLKQFPLVLLHDVAWPYGRRDMYYSPSSIPPSFRHPYGRKGLRPGQWDVAPNGGFNPGFHNALYEGGPRNGVRTAIEDWLAESAVPPHFLVVPGLHGLGIIAPAPLLQRAPALATPLNGLVPAEPIATHICSLELERLHVKIQARDTLQVSESERLRLAKSLKESMEGLQGVLRTRSWRWMAPLRHSEAFLSRVTSSAVSSAARSRIRLRALLARAIRMGRLQAAPTCAPSAIDIVLPTFNNSAATLRCLAALRRHTTAFRVIWIDNGSSRADHDTVNAALAHVPHIALRIPHRLGFVKATNSGMAVATSDVIVLLNNDTEVTEGWLRSLLSALAADPAIGIVGPVTDTPHSWQGRVSAGEGYRIVPGMVAFFCVAIRRDVIRRIGYLSEEFGEGFGDDDDYCARARAAGWKVALAFGSFVRHAHRTTFRSLYAPETIQAMQDNAMALFHKRHPERTAAARISIVVPLRMPWAATQKLWTSLEQQTVPFELLLEDGRGGAAAARNRGARRAGGEFLFFCDQDVELVPPCLETFITALDARHDAGYAYCDYDRRGALTGHHIAASFDADVLRQRNYISTMSLLRRCLFSGFDETLERFQDWDLWLTLLERGIMGTYVPRTLFTAYYRPGDISTVAATEETCRQRVLSKHGVRSRNDSPVILPDSMVTTLSQMRSNFSRE